jgi:cell volume regulation protein A
MDETVKFFHGEVTFFIRTFFFVYMGMMISLPSASPSFFLLSGLLVLIIAGARYVSISLLGHVFKEKKKGKLVLFSMMPRGLASAVLATLPLSANVPGSNEFINYTFTVIVMTNLIMTWGVFLSESRAARVQKEGGNAP